MALKSLSRSQKAARGAGIEIALDGELLLIWQNKAGYSMRRK